MISTGRWCTLIGDNSFAYESSFPRTSVNKEKKED
jgi:hypothetical protein